MLQQMLKWRQWNQKNEEQKTEWNLAVPKGSGLALHSEQTKGFQKLRLRFRYLKGQIQ
jgi:hypothetical protein